MAKFAFRFLSNFLSNFPSLEEEESGLFEILGKWGNVLEKWEKSYYFRKRCSIFSEFSSLDLGLMRLKP